MASPRASEFSASMAVLGLLVEQRDSIAGLRLRLEEVYPSAGWPANIVYTTLPSLLEHDFARGIPPVSARAMKVYEATEAGVRHFRGNLHKSGARLPTKRDSLYARLKYVRSETELRIVLRDIRKREKACFLEVTAARRRYRDAYDAGRLTPAGRGDWQCRMREALMAHEVRSWKDDAEGYRRLRAGLEETFGVSDGEADDA